MKIKIQQSSLVHALSRVQSVAERKTALPVLSNLFFEVSNGKVKISATDLEVGISQEIEAETFSKGKICIPAKSFYEMVREIPSTEIEIFEEENKKIKISSGKSKFRILGSPSEDFPILPSISEKNFSEIPHKILEEMIERTSFSISPDESRYNLHGIFLEWVDSKKMRMVATDGHRLSMIDREIEHSALIEKGVIIPKKGIQEIKKLLVDQRDKKEKAFFGFDSRNFILRFEDIVLVVRLIDGEFPKYRSVIPKPSEWIVTVDRISLIGALRRVSIVSADRSKAVRFTFRPDQMELFASNPDLGESSEEVQTDYKGETIVIGFNPRYFLDLLNSLNGEKVNIELNGAMGPAVIRSPEDSDFLGVVMPMRV